MLPYTQVILPLMLPLTATLLSLLLPSAVLATSSSSTLSKAPRGSGIGDIHPLDRRSNNKIETFGSKYRRAVSASTVKEFEEHFFFNDIRDPSGGLVTYVDKAEAKRLNLYGPSHLGGGIRIAADLTEKNVSLGRKSIRLRGKEQYGEGVFAFEITHAPVGCGIWAAAWMTVDESVWPVGGEMDIFEYGDGLVTPPEQTLHLNGSCPMPANRLQLGTNTEWQDCNSFEGWLTGNHGCGVSMDQDPDLIPARFNKLVNKKKGGAWFVMERTKDHISGWAWPPGKAPAQLRGLYDDEKTSHHPHGHGHGHRHNSERDEDILDTSLFGTPASYFPSSPSSCDLSEKFDLLHPIINLNFGGMGELFWNVSNCQTLAPSSYGGWALSENSTKYYKETKGVSVEMHVKSWNVWLPLDD